MNIYYLFVNGKQLYASYTLMELKHKIIDENIKSATIKDSFNTVIL